MGQRSGSPAIRRACISCLGCRAAAGTRHVSGQESLAPCFTNLPFPPQFNCIVCPYKRRPGKALRLPQPKPSSSPETRLYSAVPGAAHKPPHIPPLLLNPSYQHLVWLCRGPAGTRQAGTGAQCGQIQRRRRKGGLNSATISMHSLCPSPRQPAPPPPVGARNQPVVLFATYASVTPCKSMPASL